MQIQVTARHFDADDRLQEYVQKKVARLQRYYDGITDVQVVLTRNTQVPEALAEIGVSVFRKQLTARAESATHEEAVDRCVERIRRQLYRYKARLRGTDRDEHR
jgi:putative sigma-54 modulation protein